MREIIGCVSGVVGSGAGSTPLRSEEYCLASTDCDGSRMLPRTMEHTMYGFFV
jgi:hypothetical protein